MLHERDLDAEKRKYRIWPLAENWRRSGIDVRVVHGPHPCTDSDVLVPHLDCSYIEEPYWRVIQNHPRAVNARVRDICKTVISSNLLTRDDPWEGPVIVKTRNNSGGYMDLRFGKPKPPGIVDDFLKRAAWHPWIAPRSLGWTRTLTKYPIFSHLRDVPRSAWRNRHLVIERFFTPDRDEKGDFALYLWIVLGDRGIGRSLHSSDPYVKSASSRLESYQSPPPIILDAQTSLGLDYGKIDYIFHRGEAILLDVNWTPSVSGDAFSEAYVTQCRPLADGLKAIGACRAERTGQV